MQNKKQLLLGLSAILLISGCEIPEKPNFSVEQRIDLPLLKDKRFYLMGGSDAFIDTTANKIDTIFQATSENVVKVSYTDSVSLGDLNDAIPSIDVDPNTLNSAVGTIEIDDFTADFSSAIGKIEQSPQSADPISAEIGTIKPEFSGSGATSFNDLTGQNPQAPLTLIAGNKTVNVNINAGSFVSATIQSGGLAIDFDNELGFNVTNLQARLIANSDANPTFIGNTLTLTNINHGTSKSGVITFSENEVLETDIQIELTINWSQQNYQANSVNSLAINMSEDNLVVKQAVAELPAQDLTPSTPDIEINDPGFVSVVLSSTEGDVNNLSITLTNNTNIPLSNRTFTGFPTITLVNSKNETLDGTKEMRPATPSGSFLGSNETATVVFNLSGKELTKVLKYTLDLGTPGSNGQAIAVNSTDAISISATTSDMEVSEANAIIDPQSGIDLSDDATVQGDFVRVDVESGSLNLTFVNDMDIDMVIELLKVTNKNAFVTKNTGRYVAAGTEIGEINNLTIPANSQAVGVIDLTGKAISDAIDFQATASSPGSNGLTAQLTEFDEIGINLVGSIAVQSATARLKPQTFSTSDSIDIDKDNFVFTDASHGIVLKAGELRIDDLGNGLDVDLDTLSITIYSIVDPTGNPLKLSFQGDVQSGTVYPKITRKMAPGSAAPVVINLAGYSIKAINNVVKYEVYGKTEDSRLSSDPFRVISSTDEVTATISISGLEIQSALGKIIPRDVVLGKGDDVASNGKGIVDISNDNEAEVIDNESLGDLGDRLQNLNVHGAELAIHYTTNLGVKANVYMIIAGVKSDGTYLFLQGTNENAVLPTDDTSKMYYNGAPLAKSNMLKFSFGSNTLSSVGTTSGSVVFNETNSNVDEFLSLLPGTLRTLGLVVINPDDEPESYLENPILFETEMSFGIPMSISGSLEINEDFNDTDLSIIPGSDNTVVINDMTLAIRYENRFPLSVDLGFTFFDNDSKPVQVDYQPLSVKPAPVDANGFTTGPNSDSAVLRFTNASQLNKVKRMELKLSAETTDGARINLRTSDYFQLGINASTTGTTKVD